MSQKTTSLDIQKGKGSLLDIAQDFPMTLAHTVDLARYGEKFADMTDGTPTTIDLSVDATIWMSRFRTIETLDLAIREIMDPDGIGKGLMTNIPRPRILDIVPPLAIPYGALDVRETEDATSSQPRDTKKTYPDIFARKLPLGLLIRRSKVYARKLYIHHRHMMALCLIGSIVLTVPMLAYVAYALTRGYTTLDDLRGVRDPETIRTLVHSARGDFERAGFVFAPFAWIPIQKIDMIHRMSLGGLALTRGLDITIQALPQTLSGSTLTPSTQDPLAYRRAARDIFPLAALGIENPTDWIVEHHHILEQAYSEFAIAGDMYTGIVPTGERTLRIQTIGKIISRGALFLNWALSNHTSIENMLGHVNPQRYIVFNQNRDEIRANGGFPGSILSFTLYKGNILDYHSDDVYYYDWNLYPYKEVPPPGIALLTGNYGLRDVNYYPDFHETLEKANSFIERSGDASVTTAIAIHQGVIEDILEKTGPITLSGVVIPFDSHNFSRLMSTLVENRYAQIDTPKDVLFGFGSALLGQIQSKNLTLDILDILEKNRKNGEILFASRDTDVDAFLSQYRTPLPWEQSSSPNWIYPVWTSVSGNKSDRYMERSYRVDVKKIEGCKYENTLTLGTKHTFSKSDTDELQSYFRQFNISDKIEQSKLEFIQGNGKNRAYLRVYVPLGATLVGTGSDIITLSNDHATVFSTFIETPVGASTSKSWKYILDIPGCESYDGSVEWTRQPGLRKVTIQ